MCSVCGSAHHVTHAQRQRVDPTQTVLLRRAFEREMSRRFRELAKMMLERLVMLELATNAVDLRRKDEKVKSFMAWLRRAQSKKILGIEYGTPVESASSQAWMNVYIRSAYHKGISRSASKIKQAGAQVEQSWVDAAFSRPIHAERAGLIFTRAFTDLAGVTEAMDQRISRVLTQGIIEGRGMRDIGRELNKTVKQLGAARAHRIARTEVIAAHAEATLSGYEEAGAEGVEVEAEFSTSRDNKVCPKCKSLEGKVFLMKKARGMIPVHPNCRCAWSPVIRDARGRILR